MKHFDKVTPVKKEEKKALRKRWSTDRNSLYPNSRHKQDKNIKKSTLYNNAKLGQKARNSKQKQDMRLRNT